MLLIVVLILATLVGLGSWWIAPHLVIQAEELGKALPLGLEQGRAWLQDYEWSQKLLEELPSLGELTPAAGNLLIGVSNFFSGVFGLLTNLFVSLFIGLYLAFQPNMYLHGIFKLLPKSKRPRAQEVVQAIGESLKWWLVGRIFAMVVLGLMVGIGLWLLDIPLALILGILTGLLSFVPAIGAILAVIPAALIALTQSPLNMLYVLVLYVGAQIVESYLLTPAVQQYAVLMPPAVAIAAQLILGILAGPFGVALAFPLAVAGLVLIKMLYVQDVLGDSVTILANQRRRPQKIRKKAGADKL
jgi:predicted PurR-regulated permease PerM